MKVTAFLLLVVAIYGLNPTLNTALRNQVIIDFKNALVPIISKQVQTINIPDIHEKSHGFSVDITSIVIHVNPIQPSQVNIQFAAPSNLVFSGNSFGMSGSAKLHAKWKFIKKTVSVSMTVKSAGFSTNIMLLSVNSKPNIKVLDLSVSISAGNVSIHIGGGILGKIINFVVNLLKGRIVSTVTSKIKGTLPSLLTNKVNAILNSLQTDIKITNLVSLKYSFPIAPTVNNGYLHIGIVGYFHPANNPNPPAGEPKPLPTFDGTQQKGIQFFMSDFIIKSALDTAQKLNLMFIEINKPIAGHPVKMTCRTSKTPDFNFNSAISVVGSGSCDVTFDNNPNNKFTIILELNLVLIEKIKAALLFFSAEKLAFTKIEYKSDHPVDIEWFKNAINEVISVMLLVLNGELGSKGIPLPKMKEVDYSDMVQTIGNGFTMIATNPIFHFTSSDVLPFEDNLAIPQVDFDQTEDLNVE